MRIKYSTTSDSQGLKIVVFVDDDGRHSPPIRISWWNLPKLAEYLGIEPKDMYLSPELGRHVTP